ncbi:LysR family transcriptional regulator [Peptococcus simiae]|uniref:LysR family transcriptional regulator n=1 Tax=Peptococcus simiae TaxID=1643805 RepID=UPI00397FCC54
MKIEHLAYFVHLSKTGSFTKSSEHFYMTRQNFSKIIRQLQCEVGATLYIANRSGVTFTEEGKIFLNFARQTVRTYDKTMETIKKQSLNKQITGEVHVYAGIIIMAMFSSSGIFAKFLARYPNISLHMHEGDSLSALPMIQDDKRIVAILPIAEDPKLNYLYHPLLDTFKVIPLFKGEYACLVNRHHQFAQQEHISVQSFLKTSHANLFKNSVLSEMLSQYGSYQPRYSSNNLDIYTNLIANDNIAGIAALESESILDFYAQKKLYLVPFTERLAYTTSLVIHSALKPTDPAYLFSQFMFDSVKNKT